MLFRGFQGWRIPSLGRKGQIFRAESYWSLQSPAVNTTRVCCWRCGCLYLLMPELPLYWVVSGLCPVTQNTRSLPGQESWAVLPGTGSTLLSAEQGGDSPSMGSRALHLLLGVCNAGSVTEPRAVGLEPQSTDSSTSLGLCHQHLNATWTAVALARLGISHVEPLCKSELVPPPSAAPDILAF